MSLKTTITTHRFKRSHICNPVVWRNVINGYPSILLQTTIRELCHALVHSITSPIIHRCRPIITKSSLSAQLVQLDFVGKSYATGSMVALKELPPTTWWMCGDPMTPELTRRSRRSTTSCEHAKRSILADVCALIAGRPPNKAIVVSFAQYIVKV